MDGESSMIPGPPGSSSSSSGNSFVPYFIASGETFTVPLFKQALFAMNIDNEGILDIEGFLIEINDSAPIILAWTPVLTGSGGATGQTYTLRSGTSYKYGPLVFVECLIELSALGTITGVAIVSGLPYTCSANYFPASPAYFGALNTPLVDFSTMVLTGTTTVGLYGQAAADTQTGQLVQTDFTNTSFFRFTAIYLTDS